MATEPTPINLKLITPNAEHAAPLPGLQTKPLPAVEKNPSSKQSHPGSDDFGQQQHDQFFLPNAVNPSSGAMAQHNMAQREKVSSPTSPTGDQAVNRYFEGDGSLFGVS